MKAKKDSLCDPGRRDGSRSAGRLRRQRLHGILYLYRGLHLHCCFYRG